MEFKKLLKKEIKPTREKLVRRQRNQCPLCGRKINDPVLDHDHKTGAVRAALCRHCNRVEGKVAHWVGSTGVNRVEFIRRLARFWLRHQVNRTKLIHPLHGVKRKRRRKK